jgi:hypothetical protein
MNTLTRAGVHAFIILVVTHILAAALQNRGEGFRALFAAISVGAYLPFAIITAASMHEMKTAVIAAIICIVLALWPINDIQSLSAYLLPIGCGILAGQFLKSVIREDRHTPPNIQVQPQQEVRPILGPLRQLRVPRNNHPQAPHGDEQAG